MNIYGDTEFDEDVVMKIRDIDEERHRIIEEKKGENGKETRLMFEQMLRGLYLGIPSQKL